MIYVLNISRWLPLLASGICVTNTMVMMLDCLDLKSRQVKLFQPQFERLGGKDDAEAVNGKENNGTEDQRTGSAWLFTLCVCSHHLSNLKMPQQGKTENSLKLFTTQVHGSGRFFSWLLIFFNRPLEALQDQFYLVLFNKLHFSTFQWLPDV